MLWGNIYRLRGNPIVIIGFSPQWFKPWFNISNSSIIYCGCQKIMSVSRLLVIYNSGYVLPFPYTYVHKCLPHLQPFGCLVVPSNNGSAMFCFLLLISDKAKHCRAIGQNGEMIKKLQIPCLFHINVCYTSAIFYSFGRSVQQCFAFSYWDLTEQNIAGPLDRKTKRPRDYRPGWLT